jgi:hypothetical protein
MDGHDKTTYSKKASCENKLSDRNLTSSTKFLSDRNLTSSTKSQLALLSSPIALNTNCEKQTQTQKKEGPLAENTVTVASNIPSSPLFTPQALYNDIVACVFKSSPIQANPL